MPIWSLTRQWLNFPWIILTANHPTFPIPPGICLNICASPNGTFWNSSAIQTTFHLIGPPASGQRREAQADAAQWQQTITAFRADLKALEALVANPETDLFAPLPQGLPYTIFREIMVIANHNSYHIGEFAILRQVMNTWA